MARYIDADVAIRLIKLDTEFMGYSKRDAIGCIKATPTEDVVPKSELENSIPVDVSEALKQRAVKKAKAEVAREIFAAIDDAHEDCIVILGDMGYLQPSKFEQKIAELKKKYTEGQEHG